MSTDAVPLAKQALDGCRHSYMSEAGEKAIRDVIEEVERCREALRKYSRCASHGVRANAECHGCSVAIVFGDLAEELSQ